MCRYAVHTFRVFMSAFQSEHGRRLREARRAKGVTQAELARRAGCQQSAISMMESGRSTALGRETLARIAAELGVEVPEPGAAPATADAAPGVPFCPEPGCPSNVPYVVGGEMLLWPRPQPLAGGTHCAFCGEILVRACGRCQAPAAAGACCRLCGAAFVPPPAAMEADAETWASARLRAIAEWKSLTG